MLIEKIIELATDTDQPLPGLLRRCVLLGDELRNDSLKSWANQELNGYADPQKIPEYRNISAGAVGRFNAGYSFPVVERPIPSGGMQEKHRWAAETVCLGQPVSAYESMLKSQTKESRLVYPWSADMVVHYQETFMPGHALLNAWQEVSFSVIAGVLDTIRTRVLNMALDIRREIGETDADLKKVELNTSEAEKVNRIIVTNIYGGTVHVGDQQTINTQNISVGNWQDLRKALLASGIEEGDISELSQAIQEDGKTIGNRVEEWIGRNAGKVWDSGLQVGTALLTEYVKQHLGLK